jgi:DUF971 family protein
MNISKFTETSKSKADQLITRQVYIQNIADVGYQSYYLKISESEFWDIYLWKYLEDTFGTTSEQIFTHDDFTLELQQNGGKI